MAEYVSVDLGPAINAIERVGRVIQQDLNQVQGEVGQVRQDIRLTSDELRALRRDFDAYVEQAERTANIQRSETKVGTLKSELDRQYGHYAVVRRTSLGMLQAFDIGNVSNSVVRQVSEELMIQSPRYWLAPALVALAGWSRDDQEMTSKSVQEAYARDPRKTALFFALVLRRQGRNESAVRWLRSYLSSMDPTSLGREFAVLLEASAQDAFGPGGEALVSEQISEWNLMLRMRQDVVDAQVAQWEAELKVHRQVLDQGPYGTLSAVSPDWAQLREQLEAASALPVVIDTYETIRDFSSHRSTLIDELLDDILEQLVTEYDEEELPLRREVAFHEAVVDENGDLDRARARAAIQTRALEETIDAVSLQTTAAITPEKLGVSQQTQQIAIGTGQDDLRQAVGRYTAAYRARALATARIELRPDHSNYARTYGFPGWSTSTDVDEATAFGQLDHVWDTAFASFIEKARFKNTWYVGPAVIALVVIVIAFAIHPLAGVIALLGGGGLVYWNGELKKKKAAAEIAAAEKAREEAKALSHSTIRDATAEFVDARLVFDELDALEPDLLRLIDTWPAGSATAKEMTA